MIDNARDAPYTKSEVEKMQEGWEKHMQECEYCNPLHILEKNTASEVK